MKNIPVFPKAPKILSFLLQLLCVSSSQTQTQWQITGLPILCQKRFSTYRFTSPTLSVSRDRCPSTEVLGVSVLQSFFVCFLLMYLSVDECLFHVTGVNKAVIPLGVSLHLMPSGRTSKDNATGFVMCLKILLNTITKIAAQYIEWLTLTLSPVFCLQP